MKVVTIAISCFCMMSGTAVGAQAVFGPALQGVCTYGRNAALAGSAAGRGASLRLQQLQTGINADLAPQRQALVQEQSRLQALSSRPTPQLQADFTALQGRVQAFSQLEQARNAQLQQARVNAEAQIGRVTDQAAAQLVTARRCSILLDRATTFGSNQAMYITPDVVRETDRVLPTITVVLPSATNK